MKRKTSTEEPVSPATAHGPPTVSFTTSKQTPRSFLASACSTASRFRSDAHRHEFSAELFGPSATNRFRLPSICLSRRRCFARTSRADDALAKPKVCWKAYCSIETDGSMVLTTRGGRLTRDDDNASVGFALTRSCFRVVLHYACIACRALHDNVYSP